MANEVNREDVIDVLSSFVKDGIELEIVSLNIRNKSYAPRPFVALIFKSGDDWFRSNTLSDQIGRDLNHRLQNGLDVADMLEWPEYIPSFVAMYHQEYAELPDKERIGFDVLVSLRYSNQLGAMKFAKLLIGDDVEKRIADYSAFYRLTGDKDDDYIRQNYPTVWRSLAVHKHWFSKQPEDVQFDLVMRGWRV